ncbi:hypothetical protein HZC08_01675 [Candidatus Micrarchaeota archaeon]|nr:hypothetical protein [Candidatus Micrarchaeota archaeon]
MQNLAQRRIAPTPVSITSVSDRFRGYKPEPHIDVREAVVTSDKLDKLRARREALKAVDPKTAFSQLRFHPNLNATQALAQENGWLIAPNSVHDGILNRTKESYAVWTGTLVVYEAPDQPFGKEVTFIWTDGPTKYSITFQIPENLRGKKDCAIVLEHPDFILVKTGNTYPDQLPF